MELLEYVEGLREFADWIERNGEELPDILYPGMLCMYVKCESATEFRRVTRMMGSGRKRELLGDMHVERTFGLAQVSAYTARENVCERRVVATREVVKNVPDPEAVAAVPLVEVTETVEDVEWVCGPIFAGDK